MYFDVVENIFEYFFCIFKYYGFYVIIVLIFFGGVMMLGFVMDDESCIVLAVGVIEECFVVLDIDMCYYSLVVYCGVFVLLCLLEVLLKC